ncbi:MAG TPA: type II toxin-antitoxin system VapC family toxin [Acetobacteraceae bacterium]|nr:type II toxin-antitoxin system VapC family toxin [Acetobacteraceae bacterium]
MNTRVIDASIAVKWVVEEEGTLQALALRRQARLIAPELLVAECANILWMKVRRNELSTDEALLAARLLQAAEIELSPTRSLLEPATRIAVELDHPAYDCLYLALAFERDCQFVTADERLLRKLGGRHRSRFRDKVIALTEPAGRPDEPTPRRRRPRSSERGER